MPSPDLTVVIPARNEEWLKTTVDEVLDHSSERTEVIVIADGSPLVHGLQQHPRLSIVMLPQSIGQRAATNLGMQMADSKYVMKLDAHCSVGKGFDTVLLDAAETLGPNVCQVPTQYNLHVFDWQCDGCGALSYQGPEPTKCELDTSNPKSLYMREGYNKQVGLEPCGGTKFTKVLRWRRRENRRTTSWRFDSALHFQYWNRRNNRGPISDTMSCLGACWMVDREHWTKLGMLDTRHGSWGQMGTEVACKYWLSGGRLVCNHDTWYGHLFRTQTGFGFPYPMSDSQTNHAKQYSNNLWKNDEWDGQVRPLRWLVDKFWPVPGWKEEERDALDTRAEHFGSVERHAGELSGSHDETGGDGGKAERPARVCTSPAIVGAVYYTDGLLDERIRTLCHTQLQAALGGKPLVRVGLRHHDDIDVVLELRRGAEAMFEQILSGLMVLNTEYVFLVEHDVLYHPSHFDFIPPDRTKVYYNTNTWKVDWKTGHAISYLTCQTSGLCADRELLVEHYSKRLELCRKVGFSRKMGYEPGTHRRQERVDDLKADTWQSLGPNIDIRHTTNLTESRWRQDQFRDQRNCRHWKESNAHNIPGWPNLPELLTGA